MDPPTTSRCTVCLSSAESDYLDVFAKENIDKNIAAVVAKHLWFEITPTVDNERLCVKCWNALEKFHTFYLEIEELRCLPQPHTHRSRASSTDNEKTRSVSPSVLQEPTYKTEFLEIKGEPLDDDDDDDDDEDGGGGEDGDDDADNELPFDAIDGEATGKSQSYREAIKSEGLGELSASDEESTRRSKNGRSVSSSRRSKLATKKDRTSRSTEQRKTGSRVSVHPEEDKAILQFYKRIVCEVCDHQRMIVGEPLIEFLTWGALLRHTKEVHGHYKIFVQCPVCEMKLRTKVTLWQHMDMHLNPEKYRCEVCSEVHQNMKEHMQNKHEERQFSCDLCGSKFPFKKRLVVHMKKMHAEKDVRCDQCEKSFTKYTIEDHKRSVHMARFVCEHCPKTFKIRFRLRKHMQEHDKSLRTATSVPCPTCGQVMGDKYILRQHIRHMHAERQAVDCETCGKTFKNKRNLSVHLANVCMKPAQLHACTICGKQFRHKNKLKDHMASCIPN